MQKVRDPFGQALNAIRQSVRLGRYVQGGRLAISDLAEQLELSATPVREALARLAGEGLIEERRGQGYFAWRIDVVDLLELYDLQALYLRAAIERGRRGEGGRSGAACAPAAEEVFEEIVRLGANSALIRANRLLADRLAAPRRAEGAVIGGAGDDLRDLLSARDGQELLAAVAAYHARRAAEGPAIISALRGLAERSEI